MNEIIIPVICEILAVVAAILVFAALMSWY